MNRCVMIDGRNLSVVDDGLTARGFGALGRIVPERPIVVTLMGETKARQALLVGVRSDDFREWTIGVVRLEGAQPDEWREVALACLSWPRKTVDIVTEKRDVVAINEERLQ